MCAARMQPATHGYVCESGQGVSCWSEGAGLSASHSQGRGSQLSLSGVAVMSVLKTSFCGENGRSEGSEGQSIGSCSRTVGHSSCTG